jgi:AcrR family transcriptional regulator
MAMATKLTAKGAGTRARIVEAATDLILARGVAGTSLDDIRAETATSKSQLFHYFPGGKSELISAIASLQSERVLDAQRPFLDTLDTWETWDEWRDSVIAYYDGQASWGCPIGALVSELIAENQALASEIASHMDHWRSCLEAGLDRMRAASLLRPDADPRTLSLSTLAALQGGLLLAQSSQSVEPLQAALDGALAALRSAAA